MKKILKILLCLTLGCVPLFLFSCAHAEEVELIPLDSFELVCNSTYTGYTSDIQLEIERATNTYPFTTSGILFGDSTTLALPSDAVYLYSSGNGTTIAGVPIDRCAYSYYGKDIMDFSVNYKNLVVSLDMENLLDGYYRYECDFLLGVFFVVDPFQYSIGDYDLTPSYTYSSQPFFISDSQDGMHIEVTLVGEQEYTYKQGQSNVTVSLLKFHSESTFNYDDLYGTDITFNLEPAFQNIFSSLNFDTSSIRSTGRTQTAYACYNNRVWSSLFSNVDPPVTPTPTPTPSPNQDIINTNNTNTTNIISNINSGFDSLASTIQSGFSGIGTFLFGSVGDWLDFFSDIQSDIADDIPVVTFFNELQNIFANFFSIDQTDPSTLQYVAGWQSDIYTLHINALPLVLPSGTYTFFPEVNFNLNNPLMNEIRPYWLTFSNVLISLLFLRYLANYLFRWSQLLTGDTSVAFQLFHHAPDELENLGNDPYDLAGDYSYDSIDSDNHDLYQDAEAHYGHGAARYLSKVFHSK